MKKRISLGAVGYNLMAALMFAVALMPAAGLALLGFGLLMPGIGGLGMAIQKEMWVADIADNIYPDNSFFLQSRDDSAFMDGRKVHLPQAGAAPNVEKNRTLLPATASKRVDTDSEYTVDEYTTDPQVLQNTEELEASGPKRQSMLFDHFETIKKKVADTFAVTWAPSLATNFIRTTGAGRAGYLAEQTGNRKAVTKADIVDMNRILNRMDIPGDGRVLLIDADLESDLKKALGNEYVPNYNEEVLRTGKIARALGFDIMVRSSVVRYTNDGTPVIKAVGSAVAAADNLAALAWHPSFVRRALGNKTNGGILVFDKSQDPSYYGDVFSALLRAGGKKARTDEKGIVALIEASA